MSCEYHHAADVLAFIARADTPCALCVVTDISGGSMRAKGAVMAVTMGAVAGYISNGCVDGDIIAQARTALSTGRVKDLRYGEGSPFKDIALPCGGAITVKITPRPDAEFIRAALDNLTSRQAAKMVWPDGFTYEYAPPLKLRIVGRGASVQALTAQAKSMGFECHVQSPDADSTAGLNVSGFDHLIDPQTPPACTDDAWTAVVFLFHDHDWEPELLKQALAGDAFYIGALGSERTHSQRKVGLEAMGVAQADIARIHGPVGLIPSMRDANLLALSVLAQIVKTAQDTGRI